MNYLVTVIYEFAMFSSYTTIHKVVSPRMTVLQDFLTKLMQEPITKIIGKPGQDDINNLEFELAKRIAKIMTTEDMDETGNIEGLSVIVLGRSKYGTVFDNPTIEWMAPRTMGERPKHPDKRLII